MRHCQTKGLVRQRAVIEHPVIFKPSRVACVGVQMLRRNEMMLDVDHAAEPRKVAFNLVRANTVQAVGLAVVDLAPETGAPQATWQVSDNFYRCGSTALLSA